MPDFDDVIAMGRSGPCVVEWLTFVVSPEERQAWLRIEEDVWSRFLETCDGFIGKQMWIEEGDESRVNAVIWWESREKWHAISETTVRAVDERMGEFWKACTMRVFDVVRDC
jgi:uncharacterized protein (TIGR03792 family)